MQIKTLGKTALAVAAAALCGVGLTAAAQQDEFARNAGGSPRLCFRIDRIDGFASVRFSEGVDGVNLRVRNDVYQMQFATPCPGIREAERIAVDSKTPVYICDGADADVLTFSKIASPQRCKVNGLRKIAAADVASLPEKERP